MQSINHICFILIFILLLYGSDSLLYAQPTVHLPKEVNIIVNENLYDPTESWMDSLLEHSRNLNIKYEIVSTVQSDVYVTTKIRIPQVLSFSAVLQQIVLYYALLGDESSRRREKVLIYPYFTSLKETPAVSCAYNISDGYDIHNAGWETIPVPPEPAPEEKYIHNQIIEKTLENLDIIDDIPEQIYLEVALENDRSVEEVISIFRRIQLWQMATQ